MLLRQSMRMAMVAALPLAVLAGCGETYTSSGYDRSFDSNGTQAPRTDKGRVMTPQEYQNKAPGAGEVGSGDWSGSRTYYYDRSAPRSVPPSVDVPTTRPSEGMGSDK